MKHKKLNDKFKCPVFSLLKKGRATETFLKCFDSANFEVIQEINL